MFTKTAIIVIATLIVYVKSQSYQPCSIFQYVGRNGLTVGRVEFQNDYSGQYIINVNMSVATLLDSDKNIGIQLETSTDDVSNGRPIVYLIHFPIQNPLPKPTKIEFNGRLYCSAPPEPIIPGRGITNFWARNSLRTSIVGTRPVVPVYNPPETIQYTTLSYVPFTPNLQTISTAPPASRPFRPTSTSPGVTFAYSPPNIIQTMTSITRNPPNRNPLNSECHTAPETNVISLIIGGDEVREGQYPWMVAMMYKQRNSRIHKYKCTGSLVSHKHVITAAHCIQFNKALLFPLEDIVMLFGITDIEDWSTSNEVSVVKVNDVKVHPNYKSNTVNFDIAVFTLEKEISFRPTIKPICLWDEDDNLDNIVRKNGTVAGWGSDGSLSSNVSLARFVELPIVSQVDCLLSNYKYISITSNVTFCAGKRDGTGPCNGDSGAGFAMLRNNIWFLRGLVARALSNSNTCDVYNYFVFTDIAKLKDWLDSVLG